MNDAMDSRQVGLFDSDDMLFINTDRCLPAFKVDAMNTLFWKKVVDLSVRLSGITINSAFRSTSWEYSKGRSGTSQHCRGLAVDIACKGSEDRYRLVAAAIDMKFRRILIYPTFVHLDDKADSNYKVIWMAK